MIHPNARFWRAVGTLVGGIVGVGVFGLPFAFSQSGFGAGLLLLAVLGFAMSILHLMFGEVVLRTLYRHRLPGYVREYLGPGFGRAALFAFIATIWGAMLAYIIVGGTFLHRLLSPLLGGQEWMYGVALVVAVLLASRKGTLFASRLEVVVVGLMLFLFAVLTLSALPQVELANFPSAHPAGWMTAYGVVLFALSGAGIIPEMRDILGKSAGRYLAKGIVLAMGTIIVLYTCFSFAVLGATGGSITMSAIDALIAIFGGRFGGVVTLLGSCTVFSVFLVNAVQLQNSFRLDNGMKQRTAWILAVAVPFALYALGLREFVSVIGFVGAVLSGILGLFIVATYEAMRRSVVCRSHLCLQVPTLMSVVLIILFLIGIVLEVSSSLSFLWTS